jgi:hypothetical protein
MTPLSCVLRLFSWPFPCLALERCVRRNSTRVCSCEIGGARRIKGISYLRKVDEKMMLYCIRCRRRQGCFVWCNTNMPSSARRRNECAARRSAHIRSLNALFSHNECRRAAFCQTFFSRKHSAIFQVFLKYSKLTKFTSWRVQIIMFVFKMCHKFPKENVLLFCHHKLV